MQPFTPMSAQPGTPTPGTPAGHSSEPPTPLKLGDSTDAISESNQLNCCNCNKEFPRPVLMKWSTAKKTCAECKNNYNRYMEIMNETENAIGKLFMKNCKAQQGGSGFWPLPYEILTAPRTRREPSTTRGATLPRTKSITRIWRDRLCGSRFSNGTETSKSSSLSLPSLSPIYAERSCKMSFLNCSYRNTGFPTSEKGWVSWIPKGIAMRP